MPIVLEMLRVIAGQVVVNSKAVLGFLLDLGFKLLRLEFIVNPPQ